MSATGNNTFIAGFGVSSSGALSVLTSSPYNNGVAAQSLAVTPANTFLYAGTTNGIYGYTINSNGSITVLNSGNAVAQDVVATANAGRQHRGLFARVGHWRSRSRRSLSAFTRSTATTGLLTALTGSPVAPLHRQCFHRDRGYTHGMLITPNNSYVYVFARLTGGAGIDAGFGGRSHYDQTRHYSATHQYFDQPIGRRAGERSEFRVSVRG